VRCWPASQSASSKTSRGHQTAGVDGSLAALFEQLSSIPIDQDPYAAPSVVGSSERSTSLPFSNLAPARTSATRCGALTDASVIGS
jgi:hypothetical protein